MRLTRTVAVTAVAAAACSALAGCGPLGSAKAAPSSTAVPSTVAAAAVQPASLAGKAVAAGAAQVTSSGSAKVDGSIVTSTTGTSGAKVTVTFAGAERWSPSVAGTIKLTGVHVGGASIGSATLLVTPKALYVALPQLAAVLHKRWAEISLTDAASFAGVDLGQFAGQAQQLQPAPYLDLLSTSVNVKAVGTATIDGVTTQHYAGSVDLAKALAALPQIPPVWAKLATSQGIKAIHVNAWIDSADRPRKVTLSLASSAVSLTVSLHLSDYGVKVTVTAPPAGETLNLTKGLLGALS